MNSVGGTEILLILIIAAIVFGPKKMANFAKNAGRFIRKMRHLCAERRFGTCLRKQWNKKCNLVYTKRSRAGFDTYVAEYKCK